LLAIEAANANAGIMAAHISGMSEVMQNADRSATYKAGKCGIRVCAVSTNDLFKSVGRGLRLSESAQNRKSSAHISE
jgi:hypothetical protein